MANPLVGVIMGSTSDWETMKEACAILEELEVPYEKKVVSAHRTPDLMFEYAEKAPERGIEVIIAGAGGAAHLPGMVASKTPLPVIGVPVKSSNLNGLDSLLSIVQMPGGVPVATVAIGRAGAINAGLLAAQILGIKYPEIQKNFIKRRERIKQTVLEATLE
jgi:5-(carboxyamino)imidazole ribonucleotide mutase